MAQAPSYGALRQRVEAVTLSARARALAMAREAGVYDYGHLHNALVGAANGRPWREVDYAKARRAARMFEASHAPARWFASYTRKRLAQHGPAAFVWEA